jgi:hypothetical protein
MFGARPAAGRGDGREQAPGLTGGATGGLGALEPPMPLPTKKGGPEAALPYFRSRQESFALKLSPSACRRG